MSRAHDDDQRERITGRLLRVWEEPQGTSLTADASSSDTLLEVDDTSPFNDDGDGGWLYVGSQVVAYTAVDDEASTITLAQGLAAAAEDGDDVSVWNDLYGEVDTVQWADVAVEGEDNNLDAIRAVVADTISDLPNGDRGKPRETVVLERDGDEWEVVRVKGRPSKSRNLRWEQDDRYVLTGADVIAGTVTFPLSQRPIDESVVGFWEGLSQPPTEYTVNYSDRTLTWPLDGPEESGDELWVHYAYRRGLAEWEGVPYSTTGWKYLGITMADSTDRSAVGFNDSGWSTHSTPLGPANVFAVQTGIWVRRTVTPTVGEPTYITLRVDNIAAVYWNGDLVGSFDYSGLPYQNTPVITIPAVDVLESNVLAVRAQDDTATPTSDGTYLDVRVYQ